jgi:Arc/MetJ-type ribon-helix-helix transcriptional regulator
VETEKVCINIPAAELGKIDVLVAQGLYSSRTDVIRSGIRTVLTEHEETVKSVSSRWSDLNIGYIVLTKSDLEKAKKEGRKIQIVIVGVLHLGPTITPGLARETIERIRLFGSLRGPKEVRKVLEPRIVRGFD